MILRLRRVLGATLLRAAGIAVLARVFEAYVTPNHVVDWLTMYSLCT